MSSRYTETCPAGNTVVLDPALLSGTQTGRNFGGVVFFFARVEVCRSNLFYVDL